jgi:uncharacterized alkaline shock family protein YloU
MTDPHSAPWGDPVNLPAGGNARGTPPLSDDYSIPPSVVASIVRLSTLEVEGVNSVGSDGIVGGLVEMLSKRESDRGVRVTEDDQNRYIIEVHVVLQFGAELGKIAKAIQQHVRAKVMHMTSKPVAKIDVIVEGVRLPRPDMPEPEWPNQPQTD